VKYALEVFSVLEGFGSSTSADSHAAS
jgi:hypothetical protein